MIQIMNSVNSLLVCCLLGCLLLGCEEEFTPPVVNAEQQIVVEGYIEAGDRPTPAYVLLTRSFPFFSELGPEQLEAAFVHDARVTVSTADQSVVLTELCLDDIPPEFRDQVAEFLGNNPDSIGFNICVYVDLFGELPGQLGQTYELRVEVEGKVLTASTTIPDLVALDSLWFVPPPGQPNDTLAELRVILADPPGPNFYRYFTAVDDGPFQRPFTSVTDDLLFDGQRFEFPISRASEPGEDFDPATFGLFRLDTRARLKWMNIDEAHFNFWNTLEFSRANQGPFSSYTRVDHNVDGGLGIWGGIAAKYYEIDVEL
ncbi:MAG: DUF4249 domain-containing protein [Bacteroidetes bacterium]|nr:MAG: DUF4249 domain-containing protein [Bacteroidota bacterium]